MFESYYRTLLNVRVEKLLFTSPHWELLEKHMQGKVNFKLNNYIYLEE